MKNLILSLLAALLLCGSLSAQNVVYIPDANFKAALVNNPVINTNGDGEIQVAEAEAYDGAIFMPASGIADLTGIEAFTAIDTLDCSWNHLWSLDVSSNLVLKYLNCSGTRLTNLDVRSNPALEYLECKNNSHLESLNVSGCTALKDLICDNNNLASLDLSTNPGLVNLHCYYNQLESLTATFSLDCTNSLSPIGGSSILVYPNPTSGSLSVALGATYRDVTVEVSNPVGQTVFRKTFPSADQLDFSIEGPGGVYFLRVRIEGGEAITARVLKL